MAKIGKAKMACIETVNNDFGFYLWNFIHLGDNWGEKHPCFDADFGKAFGMGITLNNILGVENGDFIDAMYELRFSFPRRGRLSEAE